MWHVILKQRHDYVIIKVISKLREKLKSNLDWRRKREFQYAYSEVKTGFSLKWIAIGH